VYSFGQLQRRTLLPQNEHFQNSTLHSQIVIQKLMKFKHSYCSNPSLQNLNFLVPYWSNYLLTKKGVRCTNCQEHWIKLKETQDSISSTNILHAHVIYWFVFSFLSNLVSRTGHSLTHLSRMNPDCDFSK